MKKINPFYFKPKDDKPIFRKCDHEGCLKHADFKAPKDPKKLNEYYWFCEDHVKAYNKKWNYFKDMSEKEIEAMWANRIFSDRPTFDRYKEKKFTKEEILNTLFNDKIENDIYEKLKYPVRNTPELKALQELGLEPPVNFKEVKIAYKNLVKKYHPDVYVNQNKSDHKIKKITNAFQVLKKFYLNK